LQHFHSYVEVSDLKKINTLPNCNGWNPVYSASY